MQVAIPYVDEQKGGIPDRFEQVSTSAFPLACRPSICGFASLWRSAFYP